MGRIRSDLEDFLTQPTMIGQKKFNPTQSSPSYKSNPTQPTWDGLGQVEPMGWTNLLLLLLLLLNWVEKNNYKYIKKTQRLVSMWLLKDKQQ